MADHQNKRKQGPGGQGGSNPKKRQGGSAGRWQTPSHKAKMAERVDLGAALAVGDQGIWITYARGMRAKAVRELRSLCDEYGESLYGIKPASSNQADDDQEKEELDIEASIGQELSNMKRSKPVSRREFSIIPVGLECVCFIKTMKPVDPVEFVLKVCEDARACPDIMQRKVKYINRFSPVVNTDKATEAGITRVTRDVLGGFFDLKPEDTEEGASHIAVDTDRPAEVNHVEQDASKQTYAIRQDIRSHKTFKSQELIQRVASIVAPEHKVNLTKPDKVVLVQVFQLLCGISVVPGDDYERLKRFNVNELYRLASANKSGEAEDTVVEQDK